MPYPNPYSQRPYRNIFAGQYGQQNPIMPELRGSFAPAPINPGDYQVQSPIPPVVRPRNPYQDQLQNLYSNPSPALEQLKSHYDTMPTMDQHRPSKMNRIAAALAGVSSGWREGAGAGIRDSQAMLESPYRRAYQEWANRGQGLGVRAELEDRNAQRQIAYVKAMLEQVDKEEARKLQERGVVVSERGADLRDKEYQNPNLNFGDVGGRAVGRNPRTGEISKDLGESSGAYALRMGDIFGDQNRADAQKFTTSERLAGQGFRTTEADKNRTAANARSAASIASREKTAAANQNPASPAIQAAALSEAKKRVQMADPEAYAKVFDLETGAMRSDVDETTANYVRNKIYAQMNVIMQGQNYNMGQTPNTNQATIIR